VSGLRQRLPVIDELKGVAIVLILIYHSGGALDRPNYLHGEVGVDIFLMLSGYTLALGSNDQSTAGFARKRLLRIFPAYWFALGLFIAMDQFLRGIGHTWHSILLHATALHAFGPEFDFWDINMAFWFLALLVPLYVIYWLTRRWLTDPAAALGAGLLLAAASVGIYSAVGYHGHIEHLSVRIPAFFAGMAFALYQRRGAGASPLSSNGLLGLGLAATLYLYLFQGCQFSYTLGAAVIILAYVALRATGCLRWIAWSLSLVGTYSYEIYLLHQPLIRDYNKLFWTHWNKGAAPSQFQLEQGVGLGLAAAIVMAVPLHHVARRVAALCA